MSYVAWEVNAGEALEQVSTFCRHLLGNNSTFSDSSNPALDEVELFLSYNYARMVGVLRRYGIDENQTDATIKRLLMQYQVAYVCVDVEKTAASAGHARVGNPRAKLFEEKKDEFITDLKNGYIQSMPNIVLLSSDNYYPEWTGSSRARKDALMEDDDLVRPDITRDMMKSNRIHEQDSNDVRVSEL